ncbi:cupin-like domain-containing protein [Sphingomonas sp. BGYR3]|uniref:cupin-like domain-containing protein n=1 Tax=Sphingomonas sp. BGYR3 TaxID=2975483 RepID=UPI0021A8A607|nr:cupin-like domain-containing protein [Sphingomonas sp. BGYR3]
MTTLPSPTPIRELAGVDRARFISEIQPAGQPVVLRGHAEHWPAVRAARQSDEALAEIFAAHHPQRPVQVLVGAPEIEGRFFYTPDYRGLNFTRGEIGLEAFFERLLNDRALEAPFSIAVQSEILDELMPGFVADHQSPLPPTGTPARAWIGNRIRVSPHYDLMENIGIVVAGRRRFTLFPPDQARNLYLGPIELTPAGTPVSLVDTVAPDLVRFPRYAEAASMAQSAVLEPGDAIYIPFHWWHGVESLERFNLLVNYWWNAGRRDLPNPYGALMHALIALRQLPPDQRAAWRHSFMHLVFDDDVADHLPRAARGVLGDADAEMMQRMRATLRQMLGQL